MEETKTNQKELNLPQFISLSEAAKISGYTAEHLNLLCRKGTLKGKKVGRNWNTTKKWLDKYLASRKNRKTSKGQQIISLSEAAKISGYTAEHLNLLSRKGILKGKKVGRNWNTTEMWLTEFLAVRKNRRISRHQQKERTRIIIPSKPTLEPEIVLPKKIIATAKNQSKKKEKELAISPADYEKYLPSFSQKLFRFALIFIFFWSASVGLAYLLAHGQTKVATQKQPAAILSENPIFNPQTFAANYQEKVGEVLSALNLPRNDLSLELNQKYFPDPKQPEPKIAGAEKTTTLQQRITIPPLSPDAWKYLLLIGSAIAIAFLIFWFFYSIHKVFLQPVGAFGWIGLIIFFLASSLTLNQFIRQTVEPEINNNIQFNNPFASNSNSKPNSKNGVQISGGQQAQEALITAGELNARLFDYVLKDSLQKNQNLAPIPLEFRNQDFEWKNQEINLAKDSIDSREIARHAIQAEDIDTGSITSRTISNHTIQGEDIDPNTDINLNNILSEQIIAETLTITDQATVPILNITDKIDLGTNTIADGNFVGDWNFNGGDLTTTGNITTGTLNVGATTLSGNLDMANNIIQNIGDAGTNFTATGGLNLAGDLDVNGLTNDIAGTLNLSGNALTASGLLTITPTLGLTINTPGQTVTLETQNFDVNASGNVTIDGANFTYTPTGTYAVTPGSTYTVDATGTVSIDSAAAATLSGAGVNLTSDGANAITLTYAAAGGTFQLTDGTTRLEVADNGDVVLGDDGATTFIDGSSITLSGNTLITGTITETLTDNSADALDIQEGANNYININTINGSEAVQFGNATTNPSYSFLGTGLTTANNFGSSSVAITGGAISNTTIGLVNPSTGAFTTLTSSGNTTLATGINTTNTFGSGASSVNTIGSVTTPGALTLHGVTTLNNTFFQTGANTFSTGTGAVSLNGSTTITGSNTFTTGTGILELKNVNTNISSTNPIIDLTSASTLSINTTTNRPVTFGTGNITIPNLYVTNYQQNNGTFSIISTVATGTIFSVSDNAITNGTLIGQNITANAGNGQTSSGQIINLVDSTIEGGGYTGLAINVSGAGGGSGSKNLLDLNPGINQRVVFDSAGAFRPTTSVASNTNTIGSSDFYWKNGYFDQITANNISGVVVGGATSSTSWTIGSTQVADVNESLIFYRNNLGAGNATLQWNAGASDLRYFTTNYPFNTTYMVNDTSISPNINLLSGNLTNNTTSGTQKLLSLTNTGTGITENGIYVNNTGTGTTAIEINGTWTNGIITNNNTLNTGTGTITSGLINGQTISATADFTGTVDAATGYKVNGAATAGNVLRGDGTNFVSAILGGGDITGAALTDIDDTNVTLTLTGNPTTALLRATGLTLGWTGQLAVARGGTGVATFATNGVLYGNAATSILVTTAGTSGQILQANGSGVPTFVTFSTDATIAVGGALTLATVNANVGSFGSSTAIPTFTVNGKGLITAASTAVVIAPAGTLSGTTLNATVVTSSLTSVGTLGSLAVTGAVTWSGGGSANANTAYTHSQNDADTSATNEIQTLGTSGNTITLTSGGSVTAPYATSADLLDGQHGSYYAPLANISGTDHYVAKFNGTSALENSLIYDNGTNVGIGTAAPAYTLDVNKSINSYLQQIYNTNTGTSAGGLYIRTDGTGNLLTLNKSGSDIVTISDTNSTFNNPTAFTAAGDVSMAYDLIFNNSTASYIKSAAPMYLEAGEVFNSSDLTLRTFNYGSLVLDSAYLTSTKTQSWTLATAVNSLNIASNLLSFDTTNSRVGIGTNAPGTTLDVVGAVRTNNQLISTVATGTAPLAVTSTTVVTNLNADLWDGSQFASYLNQAVLTTSNPTFGTVYAALSGNATTATTAATANAVSFNGGLTTGSTPTFAAVQLGAGGYVGLSGGTTYGIGVSASNRNSAVFDTVDTVGSDPLQLVYYSTGAGVTVGDSGTDHPLTVYGTATATNFIGPGTGLTGTAASLTAGAATTATNFNNGTSYSSGGNVYATTFNGALSGNATSATNAYACSADGTCEMNAATMNGNLTLSGALYIPATQAWSGDPGASYGKIQYHANRWYIVADSGSDRIVQFRRNGTDLSYIDNAGTFIGNISGNADSVDSQHFAWSNADNNPTYLWGANANGSSFLAA